ncbi:DUF1534 domain-containing protein [Pseudomonas orientalis]|uniref:DUF1534 domain-containing protein n=1 Tax=Pseudomonas orientalis TaxID=76758 RepID=A0A4Q7CV84_9PSED|nr:DUF1534 domain-containing protein [Pseudomonas orientalis]
MRCPSRQATVVNRVVDRSQLWEGACPRWRPLGRPGFLKIVPTLPRGNASRDALRHRRAGFKSGRGASLAAFPRRAWERSEVARCFCG